MGLASGSRYIMIWYGVYFELKKREERDAKRRADRTGSSLDNNDTVGSGVVSHLDLPHYVSMLKSVESSILQV